MILTFIDLFSFIRHGKQVRNPYVDFLPVYSYLESKIRIFMTISREEEHERELLAHGQKIISRKKDSEQFPDFKPRQLNPSRAEKLKSTVSPKLPLRQKVDEARAFTVKDGRRLYSCLELADVLETLPDEVYRQHVTDKKNDFASWVTDVYGQAELGDKLDASKDRRDMLVQLLKYILVECNLFNK
jgi:hypothetical protein